MEYMDDLRYLRLLAKQYPSIGATSTEIINLQAILNLPKGTEHFISDIHGEVEAFIHICNNASGVIREKVDMLFDNIISTEERAVLSTLIYYPEAKLKEFAQADKLCEEWYRITLNRLLKICRLVSSKYTRSKVRRSLPADFSYIIEELLNTNYDLPNKEEYYENIIASIIEIGRADNFVTALCTSIKSLVVDRLHIVGDIFDRGPRADIVMDTLMKQSEVDIEWGNHDVLWMGAASGSRTCIAVTLNNSITYNNLEVIETGYGISLRPLALFANEYYSDSDVSVFMPKLYTKGCYKPEDMLLVARMHKAIAIIQFKLEGQIIGRNPCFNMEERRLLDKINFDKGTVLIDGKEYALTDTQFPTLDTEHPYALSPEESELMQQLKFSFLNSEKLSSHVKFLYAKGALYTCYNSNLLYHGSIPMNEDGSFMELSINGKWLFGKALMDYCDLVARQGYHAKLNSHERQFGKDFLWFLWCGKDSPLFGRKKATTFERLFVQDKDSWTEEKNSYYKYCEKEEACVGILAEFGLFGEHCHIVNGHVPVRTKDGESPIKANGRLIVIDGGFCRAYQATTGIAGYTLIYNSYGIRISSHEPFNGRDDAIKNNKDILSRATVFDRATSRIKVLETDEGQMIEKRIVELKKLLAAYYDGAIIAD